jgi:hypothetical protein
VCRSLPQGLTCVSVCKNKIFMSLLQAAGLTT